MPFQNQLNDNLIRMPNYQVENGPIISQFPPSKHLGSSSYEALATHQFQPNSKHNPQRSNTSNDHHNDQQTNGTILHHLVRDFGRWLRFRGVTMSLFSFQIPKPLQENYVRNSPARLPMPDGSKFGMSRADQTILGKKDKLVHGEQIQDHLCWRIYEDIRPIRFHTRSSTRTLCVYKGMNFTLVLSSIDLLFPLACSNSEGAQSEGVSFDLGFQ
ncbi:uncharacterized protein [Spinacia oleracea]|uniref:Uncharacterized protein isoform X2 n=1 Tax=Spinacia oleracea TaxID=3562 RepID=A0ABM3R2R6_SPIOL|nr:uncharacterized protein LOC110792492 isoform X2 [Spinacia oleracea]